MEPQIVSAAPLSKMSASAIGGMPPNAQAGLMAYMQNLGLSDQTLCEQIAGDCAARAGRRLTATAADDEWLAVAIDEFLHRLDRELTHLVALPHGSDTKQRLALRAALLLGGDGVLLRSVLTGGEAAVQVADQLRALLPQATPPEVPLAMPEQVLTFFPARPASKA